jgi:uncharacterized protein YraI
MHHATESLDRRQFARLLMAGTAAVALTRLSHPGEVGAQEAAAAATSSYRTATDLRLRTGPSTRRRIILVMPKGVTVTNLGAVKNGFAKVSYKGTEGWASLDFLIATYGSQDPVLLGSAITTTAVNLRSGPSTSNQVLRVLAAGASVQTSDTVKNGFRYVVHDGLAGWVYDTYLKAGEDSPPAGTLVTTTALNLRAEPNTNAKILTVMPEGTKVTPTGKGYAGFVQVVYGNLTGWAAGAYLN